MKKSQIEAEQLKEFRDKIVAQAEEAIALRNKDREFHGLEREFLYHQADLIVSYNRTKELKHPRDMGNARENILRNFLINSGTLAKKYGVSDTSIRVVSREGHLSNEIDIAIFDPDENITLMNRENAYEVYPVESVYGVIQVKSNLIKKELISGLKNLRSFKKLNNDQKKGFAILFAYCSDMSINDIRNEILNFTKETNKNEYPNAIYILDKGFFLFSQENKGFMLNNDIESIENLDVTFYANQDNLVLYNFMTTLGHLLKDSKKMSVNLHDYFRLPLIASDYSSYIFTLGQFAEFGICPKHGTYAKKISGSNLDKILLECKKSEPINWIKAVHIAYGIPLDEEAYLRQPAKVHIYNPENLSLSEILKQPVTLENGDEIYTNSYEMIESSGIKIYLPFYYIFKDGLMDFCVKCK
ncbi:TPA: DUF6602 domain-containing protein [Acinetobacter baumannii]|nr:hypothetical protein [Acinetobacter baumannii]